MLSDSDAAEVQETFAKRNRPRILIIGFVALVVVGALAFQTQSEPLDELAARHQALERQELDFGEDNLIPLETDLDQKKSEEPTDFEALDDAALDKGDIAYGGYASSKKFPFVTRVHVGGTCTGEIIKRDWILTAKHCVKGKSPSNVKIFAGSDHRSHWWWNIWRRQKRTGKRIVRHPTMDAALVQLSKKWKLNSRVQPVQYIASRVPFGRIATAVGWGATGKGAGHKVSKRLKSATMKIMSKSFCTSHGAKAHEICTKGGSGNTCGGDSGGPLVYPGYRKHWTLVGINAWSKTSCSNKPHNVDVFQSVPRFRRWLFRTVGRRKCQRVVRYRVCVRRFIWCRRWQRRSRVVRYWC